MVSHSVGGSQCLRNVHFSVATEAIASKGVAVKSLVESWVTRLEVMLQLHEILLHILMVPRPSTLQQDNPDSAMKEMLSFVLRVSLERGCYIAEI